MIGWRTFVGPAIAIVLVIVLIFTGVIPNHHSSSPRHWCKLDIHLIQFPTMPETTAKQALEGWAWLELGDHSYTAGRDYFIDDSGRWGLAARADTPGNYTVLGMIPACHDPKLARESMIENAKRFVR